MDPAPSESGNAARERTGRRADGPASRWKPVRGRAPAKVPKPRPWPYLGTMLLGLVIGVPRLGEDGAAGVLGILACGLAGVCALLIRAERHRYVAHCALSPGDAGVLLDGPSSRWRLWVRLELPGQLVRSIGATWPQAWALAWSGANVLVVDVDRAVAQALVDRLRAVGAAVEVVEPSGTGPPSE